jgi:hypothetical protein
MSSYAYKSVAGAFTDPDAGTYPFIGQEGIKKITVVNTTDRTVQDTAADGTIMKSYVSGASGAFDIETQQTSSLHQFLVNWANIKFTQAENGGGANFGSAAMKVIDLINGSIHTGTGMSPLKIPDKNYDAAGGFVTWRLICANMVTQ